MFKVESRLEENFSIEKSIQESICWYGKITGLDAQEMLRGKQAHTYLLRAGEKPQHYYISSVEPESGYIRHTPIEIRYVGDAWFCRNYFQVGPCRNERIEEIIHKLMHCAQGLCQPLSKQA